MNSTYIMQFVTEKCLYLNADESSYKRKSKNKRNSPTLSIISI